MVAVTFFLGFTTTFLYLTVADNYCPRNEVYFKKADKTRLNTTKENIIHSEKMKISEQCFGICRSNTKCKSFNAERLDGSINCTLLQVTRSSLPTEEVNVIKDVNVSYFELESCGTLRYIGFTDAKDCLELYQKGYRDDGIYSIVINKKQTNVFCDMNLHDGGWTLIQKRDAKFNVDFYRDWVTYLKGFGDLNYEFWLGNQNIHQLTKDNQNQVLFVLKRFTVATEYYALYNGFNVASEALMFQLTISDYQANKFSVRNVYGDAMAYHNGMEFSTFDKDNDLHEDNCAEGYNKAGYWFNSCKHANLNGVHKAPTWETIRVNWKGITSSSDDVESLEATRIYIRRLAT